MAACKASAARLEQCILTGGRPSRLSATSPPVIFKASSMVFPFASSVIMLLVAMVGEVARYKDQGGQISVLSQVLLA